MKCSNLILVKSTREKDKFLLHQALFDVVKSGNKVEICHDLVEPEVIQISEFTKGYDKNGFISRIEMKTKDGERLTLVSSF